MLSRQQTSADWLMINLWALFIYYWGSIWIQSFYISVASACMVPSSVAILNRVRCLEHGFTGGWQWMNGFLYSNNMCMEDLRRSLFSSLFHLSTCYERHACTLAANRWRENDGWKWTLRATEWIDEVRAWRSKWTPRYALLIHVYLHCAYM